MWGTNEPFPSPASPFRVPISPPSVDPDEGGDLVSVTLAREWLPAVLGALQTLTLQATWRGTPAEVEQAIWRAELLIEQVSMGVPPLAGIPETFTLYREIGPAATDGTPVAGQWYAETYNNIETPPSWLTFSTPNSLFTLAPGVYDFLVDHQYRSGAYSRVRVISQSPSGLNLWGTVQYSGPPNLSGRIVVPQSTIFAVQCQWLIAGTNGRGQITTSDPGIIATCQITRLGDAP